MKPLNLIVQTTNSSKFTQILANLPRQQVHLKSEELYAHCEVRDNDGHDHIMHTTEALVASARWLQKSFPYPIPVVPTDTV